jgi:divinyl chlorophyllide a 8-vinyl-reductase
MINHHTPHKRRVFMLGATGTIGKATHRELLLRGHDVVCFGRAPTASGSKQRTGDVADPKSIERDGFRGESFDVVVSCMASRSGAPKDAWAIDHKAHSHVLNAAQKAKVGHFVLLSAICVQKPELAFQHAKLAFEAELVASGLAYSIIRPTAYFKSLSGQVARVKAGKPFLLFGNGTLTACKPISDRDLASYLANSLDDLNLQNAILPIGGPGPAVTPREQGEKLFHLLGTKPRFRHVPVQFMDGIIATLGALGKISSRLADKAEFARIGRYYATESMLVLNLATGLYDADATPGYGSDTLQDFHAKLITSSESVDLGQHAVF